MKLLVKQNKKLNSYNHKNSLTIAIKVAYQFAIKICNARICRRTKVRFNPYIFKESVYTESLCILFKEIKLLKNIILKN